MSRCTVYTELPSISQTISQQRLCVIRYTKRILVPVRATRLGNFGVTRVSDAETWVTAAEWMQPAGCKKHGYGNTVFVAPRLWK